jgi:hypothetical protein
MGKKPIKTNKAKCETTGLENKPNGEYQKIKKSGYKTVGSKVKPA